MSGQITTEIFIVDCVKAHNNKYDYSKTSYTNYYGKVCIICPVHGEFWQRAGDHKRGNGCKPCGNSTATKEQFINKAIAVHGNKYDYSLVNYVNSYTNIVIVCKLHAEQFVQQPRSHLVFFGCNKCAKNSFKSNTTLTTEEFIYNAKIVHKDSFDYSKVEYKHSQESICIICKVHGEFWQKPFNHILGHGCQKCSHRISKPELAWLNSFSIPELEYQKQLIINDKQVKVDGFDPTTNTVYEFYGDFWHGNPDIYDLDDINNANHTQYRVLYNETMARETLLKSAGYNIVSIWENDWLKRNKYEV